MRFTYPCEALINQKKLILCRPCSVSTENSVFSYLLMIARCSLPDQKCAAF